MDYQVTAVFVYGTLKRGQLRESMWPREPLSIVPATVEGELYDLGPYPAVLPAENGPGDWIGGEVWSFAEIDIEQVLDVLDEIECYDQPGEPSLYLRVITGYETVYSQRGSAFIYQFADRESLLRQACRVAPGGDGICRWPHS